MKIKNLKTESLVAELKNRMHDIKPYERVELSRSIMDGFCKECGYEHPAIGRCQCWNDD